jgi:hypothetical protein
MLCGLTARTLFGAGASPGREYAAFAQSSRCRFKFSNANDLFENMFKTEGWQDDDSSHCPYPLHGLISTLTKLNGDA